LRQLSPQKESPDRSQSEEEVEEAGESEAYSVGSGRIEGSQRNDGNQIGRMERPRELNSVGERRQQRVRWCGYSCLN